MWSSLIRRYRGCRTFMIFLHKFGSPPAWRTNQNQHQNQIFYSTVSSTYCTYITLWLLFYESYNLSFYQNSIYQLKILLPLYYCWSRLTKEREIINTWNPKNKMKKCIKFCVVWNLLGWCIKKFIILYVLYV